MLLYLSSGEFVLSVLIRLKTNSRLKIACVAFIKSKTELSGTQ